MKRWVLLNRRQFVREIGGSLATVRFGASRLFGEKMPIRDGPRFAYVGTAEKGIQVFAVVAGGWEPIQRVASDSPRCLILHPSERFLFAVNEVSSCDGLPSGTIESYGISAESGRIALLNRQVLSLSGTKPRHGAVSPDGRHIVVAVSGGGAYNVLPIDVDGRLGRVSGIVKEIGCGPVEEHQDASHPRMVMFDPAGRFVLGVDRGCDRLSVFALSSDGLTLRGRRSIEPGSGPGSLALHPSGRLVYVMNELDGTVSCFGYDAIGGRVLERLERVAIKTGGGVLVVHPSGRFLYTSGGVNAEERRGVGVWQINSPTGALTWMDMWTAGVGAPAAIALIADGSSLLVLSQETVIRLRVDSASGRLSDPVEVAEVEKPLSVAVKYL
jgi:6-phosphogluconolactonase (cycloisomerase 2 family)